jgi:hypothetical protein
LWAVPSPTQIPVRELTASVIAAHVQDLVALARKRPKMAQAILKQTKRFAMPFTAVFRHRRLK